MDNFKFRSQLKTSKVSDASFKNNLHGFGMIEVLIAMVIIAIVAVGATQLVITSIRSEYDAQLRRTALMLLNDIADRMKSNRSESTTSNGANYTAAIPGSIPSVTCIGLSYTSCTPALMATYDLWDWGQYIQALLPAPASGPVAKIVLTTSGTTSIPPVFTATINWTGSANSSQSASLVFSTPF